MRTVSAFLCVFFFMFIGVCSAQQTATQPVAEQQKAVAKEIPDKPTAVQSKPTVVPVIVEQTGEDTVGGRLAYHLKELFSKSALFTVTVKDEKKIKILLDTQVEFQGRPSTSSIYSAVWVYSENEGTLKYYLASESGLVHGVSVKDTAEILANRTHEVFTRYSYLFE